MESVYTNLLKGVTHNTSLEPRQFSESNNDVGETMSQATYASVYENSVSNPEQFWLDAAQAVEWVTPPTKALDDSRALSTVGSPMRN